MTMESALTITIETPLLLNIDNYVYAVPFVYENDSTIFLKTIFPTRKSTKKYLQEKLDEKK